MTGATKTEYELVAGIETHVQLRTRTKLFCSCAIRFGAPPNTMVCPVCLGHPGSLPVLNRAAFELGLRAALALNCEIAPFTKFDRKNYFYPDLPKNYQITQYDLPFSHDGWVEIETGKKIRILRAHLEEDAGKLIHEEQGGRSTVDLNRTGVPLAEIVTHPDLRSADEAYQYMIALRTILQYAGASDCDMEKGELRCDVNVSIRPKGAEKLGTKVEVKNLNSFKNAKAAMEHEYARQVKAVEAGEPIRQETRLWDAEKGVTRVMRSKEEAHDYRYFPEPDLPPVKVDAAWIARVRAAIPEMPAAKRARFAREYGLGDYDAKVLSFDRAMADFFESAAKLSGKPKPVANWLVNDLNKILNERKLEMAQVKATPEGLVELISLVESGALTGASAREVFLEMVDKGAAPSTVVKDRGLAKVSDSGAIEEAAKAAIAGNPKAAADFKAGKEAALKSLIGGVMKATKGRADPKLAEEVLRKLLS
ncbi:MAG TPA: Asp-tRNA(Asn)/Glu-tRNA(Gln) amidotransferase subunit GatB [Planctomycetota bacterium]|nr:Asp-tRNA(Asn)/Glu-tRNA(Gln) amidotransferase subunit GatB [Planctomycetota bacterium]